MGIEDYYNQNPVYTSDAWKANLSDALSNPAVPATPTAGPGAVDTMRGYVSNLGAFMNKYGGPISQIPPLLATVGSGAFPRAVMNAASGMATTQGRAGAINAIAPKGNPPTPAPTDPNNPVSLAAPGSYLQRLDTHHKMYFGAPDSGGGSSLPGSMPSALSTAPDLTPNPTGDNTVAAPVLSDTPQVAANVPIDNTGTVPQAPVVPGPQNITPASFIANPSLDTSVASPNVPSPAGYTPPTQSGGLPPDFVKNMMLESLTEGVPSTTRFMENTLAQMPAIQREEAEKLTAQTHAALLPYSQLHLQSQAAQEQATAKLRLAEADPQQALALSESKFRGEVFGKQKGAADFAQVFALTPEGKAVIPDDVRQILKVPATVKTQGDLRKMYPTEYDNILQYIKDYQDAKLLSNATVAAAEANAKFATVMGAGIDRELETARRVEQSYTKDMVDPTGAKETDLATARQMAAYGLGKPVMTSDDLKNRDINRTRLKMLEGQYDSLYKNLTNKSLGGTPPPTGRRVRGAPAPVAAGPTSYSSYRAGVAQTAPSSGLSITDRAGNLHVIPGGVEFQVTPAGTIQTRR